MSTATFGKLKQESTSGRIYEAIREAIFTSRLKPGDRLTELHLAREFQVSRASLREAMQRLAHEGLIELNSYKGARVVELTPKQLEEMLALRLLLESEAVRQARGQMTAENKEVLLALARKLDNQNVSSKLLPAIDLQLHQKIWEISGNATLERHLNLLVAPLFVMGAILRYTEYALRRIPEDGESRVDHLAVIDALCQGSEEQAVESIKRHILDNWKLTRTRIEDFLRQQR